MAAIGPDSVSDGDQRRWRRLDRALLVGLAAFFCLVQLGSGSLRDWDEATYAQIAREFVASGDWITPTIDGEPFFDKPPLTMWVMAVGYSLAGVSEAATRLGSALAGIATILLTYELTRRTLGRRCALLAGLLLLTTPPFLKFSKMGMTDVPLAFFVALALYAYWRSLEDDRWLLAAGAAFGLAFMSKHAAAVFAPAAALLHALVFREVRLLRSPHLAWGAALALAIVLPWHLLLLLEWKSEFWDAYVGYHMLGRSVRPLQGHFGGPFFYLGVLVEEQRPWFLLSFVAVPYCTALALRERRPEVGLFACWALAVLAVATLIPTRLEWYVMPIYPALAACNAILLARLVPPRHYAKAVAVLLALLVVQAFTSRRIFDLDYSPESKQLGERVRSTAAPGEPLCIYGLSVPALRFYAERPAIRLEPDALRSLAEPPCSLLATRQQRLEELRAWLPERELAVIASAGDRRLLRLGGPRAEHGRGESR